VLEIRVPEILGNHRFAAEHYQGAQPDIALSSLNVGKRILEQLTPIAACRRPWRALRGQACWRNTHTQHQKTE
jgi:hypothetical protein